MTVFLPLEASSPFPQAPSFLVPSPSPDTQVKKVIKTLLKARRVAVVCGAGISVQAGIPDFRSSEGLFQTLRKDNPMLSSGRDLFDASVFNSEATTSLFCQMIAQLAALSEDASPTAFHRLLRALDDRGRLLRVYTQNIDALESKSGLTFGVPDESRRKPRPRSSGKADSANADPNAHIDINITDVVPVPTVDTLAGPSRLPSPPVETPRCIPLHGTLQLMYCQICMHSFPLGDYRDALTAGHPPCCPECTNLEATRQLVGKRSRGVGKLRPSVVLYNEMHKDGEGVGDVVARDLIGSSKGKGRAGADLLLVVGTSLRVPGTKRIVREFAKAVRSRSAASSNGEASCSGSFSGASTSMDTGLATPTTSPRRSPAEDDEPPMKTVYLNFDFPVPTREWESVFDVWIQGDAQRFAQLVFEEIEQEERAKEAAVERKRRREEIAEERERERERREQEEAEQGVKPTSVRKRKTEGEGAATPKRRKAAPLSPTSIPKKGRSGKPASSGRSKAVSGTKLKGMVPVDDVLPSAHRPRKRTPDSSSLKIRIPPPSQRPLAAKKHFVPEVYISPRGYITPPTPSPPASPLTPIPSSSRRTSPCKSPVRGPVTHTYSAAWATGELSDLTDDSDMSTDGSSPPYTHSPHHGHHNGLAIG